MIRSKDLIGMRFGLLTVVSMGEKRKTPNGTGVQMMNCICDCGNATSVSRGHLLSGDTKSCGCQKLVQDYEDLTGKKFNKLTVIEHLGKVRVGSNQSTHLWKCQCDCGNICEVSSRGLRSGRTKSCGCIQGETLRSMNGNKYDLSKEYGIGYFSDGTTFKFDLDDYELIRKYTWYKTDSGYAITTYKNNRIRMHRLIMGLTVYNPDRVVDHINHDTTDNRRANLRVCTSQENACNNKTPSNNTSGHIGVTYLKEKQKYKAYLAYQKRFYDLGIYDTYEQAVKARVEAEEKYYGEFSPSIDFRKRKDDCDGINTPSETCQHTVDV